MEIFIALLSASITGILSLLGVIYSTKKQHDVTVSEVKNDIKNVRNDLNNNITLIQKDITNLAKDVKRHNGVIERVYLAEKAIEVLEERQNIANDRIKDLERKE